MSLNYIFPLQTPNTFNLACHNDTVVERDERAREKSSMFIETLKVRFMVLDSFKMNRHILGAFLCYITMHFSVSIDFSF